jgi:hypothetical protein
MRSFVSPSDDLFVERSNDVVSPELALVDPALAEHARSWLSNPEDTLTRVERLVRAHRIAASRAVRAEVLGIPPPEPLAAEAVPAPRATPSTHRRSPGHRRSALLAGSVAAATLVAALLVGVRVDVRGTQAVADTTAIGEPPPTSAVPTTQPETQPETQPTTKPKTKPKTQPQGDAAEPKRGGRTPTRPPAPPTNAVIPRRFAWAPAAAATGYHVEFFRGSSLVFSANTKRPDVSIPKSWTLGGKPRTFGPGEYRWYVWPIVDGRRASQAIVQAKLVVPQS